MTSAISDALRDRNKTTIVDGSLLLVQPKALLSDRDLDLLVALSRSKRWSLRKEGRFPNPIRVDRRRLYRAGEIEEWLDDPEGWATRDDA